MEDDFTSGPWTGFYTYALNQRRERMDLSLTFKEGILSGRGNDPVGPFVIRGRYDAQSNEVWWTKTYIERHDVFYKGFRDSRGIWGTWEIESWSRGGFHIWPKGQGEGLSEQAEADVEIPAEAVAVGTTDGVKPPSDPGPDRRPLGPGRE